MSEFVRYMERTAPPVGLRTNALEEGKLFRLSRFL